MKIKPQIFFLISIILNINLIKAQHNVVRPDKVHRLHTWSNTKHIDSYVEQEEYLSFDFETGMPLNWEAYNLDGNDYFFVWSDSLRHGAYGDFGSGHVFLTEPEDAIQSFTSDNGYLVFHADYYNCLIGDFPLEMNPSYSSMHSVIETNWLDIGNQTDVFLEFDTWFRLCCSPQSQLSVEITSDSINWAVFDVRSQVKTNKHPPRTFGRNRVKKLYCLDTIPNFDPTHFKVRWRFNEASHYHWEIDDVKILNPISSLKREDVYDYNLGDYLDIKERTDLFFTGQSSYNVFRHTVVEKTYSPDMDTVHYKFFVELIDSYAPQLLNFSSDDTVEVSYTNLKEYITFGESYGYYQAVNFDLDTITKYYDYDGREVIEFFYSDGFERGITMYYVEGLGGQYYSYNNAGDGYAHSKTLEAYYIAEEHVYINTYQTDIVSIHPNPANDFLWLRYKDEDFKEKTVEIINLSGELVKLLKMNESHVSIDISDLNSGVYIVKIGEHIKKVIVE